jgi:hypothetical protein
MAICDNCTPDHTVRYLFAKVILFSSVTGDLSRDELSSLSFRKQIHEPAKLYLINHVNSILRAHYKLEGNESLYRIDELQSAIEAHEVNEEVGEASRV